MSDTLPSSQASQPSPNRPPSSDFDVHDEGDQHGADVRKSPVEKTRPDPSSTPSEPHYGERSSVEESSSRLRELNLDPLPAISTTQQWSSWQGETQSIIPSRTSTVVWGPDEPNSWGYPDNWPASTRNLDDIGPHGVSWNRTNNMNTLLEEEGGQQSFTQSPESFMPQSKIYSDPSIYIDSLSKRANDPEEGANYVDTMAPHIYEHASPVPRPLSPLAHERLSGLSSSFPHTSQANRSEDSDGIGLFGTRPYRRQPEVSVRPGSFHPYRDRPTAAAARGILASSNPRAPTGASPSSKPKVVRFATESTQSTIPQPTPPSADDSTQTGKVTNTVKDEARGKQTNSSEATQEQPRHDVDSSVPEVDIWPLYLDHALVEDKETVQAWNTDLDSILIFAALFSAVLTTMVIESYQNLQPNPQVELLRAVLLQLQKNSGTSESPTESPVSPFKLTRSAVRVNVYWFCSLIISLATSLLVILAKQWVNYLLAGLSPVPHTRGRHRQYRMDGLHKWNLPAVLSFLPLLLHVSLLLFFAGLVDFIWDLNDTVGATSAVLVVATFLVYATTNFLSYIYPDCPFKTSVTVFISFAHRFGSIVLRRIFARVQLAWETVRIVSRHVGRLLSAPSRSFGRRALRIAVSELRRSTTLSESAAKPNYDALRISALRAQDEKYILQNASLMDARVFIWLIRNVGRLAAPEDVVGHALVRFPHLVLHRELLIQEGASAFLERVLKRCFVRPWSELSTKQRQQVSSIVRGLGALASEAEIDGVEFADSTIPDGTLLDSTPFLPVQRPQRSDSTFLTQESLELLGHLLTHLGQLPLPLASFTLRLSVQLTEGRNIFQWIQLGGGRRVEEFLQRLMDFDKEQRPRAELIPAVNTVIYLALCDAARTHLDVSSFAPTGKISYWLSVLLDILHHVRLDAILLRQVCWAICTLSWTLSPQPGVTVRPLVPRLRGMHSLPQAFTELLSCDQDPDVLTTVISALERMLWTAKWDGQEEVCQCLHKWYKPFLDEFCTRTRAGKLPNPETRLVSLTRIAAYLSFFDKEGPDNAKAHLIPLVFNLLDFVSASKTQATKLIRPWVYRAACRMVQLYLIDPRWSRTYAGPDFTDMLYTSTDQLEATYALGAELVAVVESLSQDSSPDQPRWRPLPHWTMEQFCRVMHHALTEGLRPSADVRDIGAWDPYGGRMVAVAIKSQRLLDVLLSSDKSCVHVEILTPLLHYVCMTLYAGPRHSVTAASTRSSQIANQALAGTVSPWDPRHPARHMARAIRDVYVPFLDEITRRLKTRFHPSPLLMHEMLGDLICISGYLAFFEHMRELPREDISDAMVDYLRALASSKVLPASVRRSAWIAVGHMALLYLAGEEKMARVMEENPIRFFRGDHRRERPDDVAIGFIMVVSIEIEKLGKIKPQSHCRECALDMTIPNSPQIEDIPDVLAVAALEMMVGIWDGTDWESLAIRDRLLHHGINEHIGPLSTVDGEIGELVEKLMRRIEMTAVVPTVQRRSSM